MDSLLDGIDLHPRCVDSALVGLNTVVARLAARNDSRAVFPDVYGIITRNVAREVRRGAEGCFLEPEWISRLAGRFAERYFETLAWVRGPAMMPVTREVAMFVLGRWRAQVWTDVLALVHAPSQAARQAVIARMHQRSQGLGRLLSVGTEVRRLARAWGFAPARAAFSRVRPLAVLRLVPAPAGSRGVQMRTPSSSPGHTRVESGPRPSFHWGSRLGSGSSSSAEGS